MILRKTIPAGASELLDSATASTFIGGGQVGYNWQNGHMVYGIEGDFDFQHWNTTRLQTVFNVGTIFVPGDTFSVESRWQASLRGRLGYAWDRYLVYATGGVAFTDVRAESNWVVFGPDPATSGSSTTVLVGGTVGGGVAYAFWNNLSLGIEGRYTWYGSHTFDTGLVALAAPPVFTSTSQTIRLSTSEVLAKLNWKF
jgi:outer membrane immunogenic protein